MGKAPNNWSYVKVDSAVFLLVEGVESLDNDNEDDDIYGQLNVECGGLAMMRGETKKGKRRRKQITR